MRIGLIGGGHAHALVLARAARRRAADFKGADVTLISRKRDTLYTGMLPSVVAGDLAVEGAAIDVAGLCAAAGARFMEGEVRALDPDAKTALLRRADGAETTLSFDTLSINVGSETPAPRRAAHVTPVRPLDRVFEAWTKVADDVRRGEVRHIGVVGAGAGGCELAVAIADALKGAEVTVTLYGASARPAPELPAAASRALEKAFARAGVAWRGGVTVKEAHPTALLSEAGETISCDHSFWTTGATAPAWLGTSGLSCDDRGFPLAGPDLRSLSHPDVFATGDAAALRPAPAPKAGVYAVRQAPRLHHNLLAAIQGQNFKGARPQRRRLSLLRAGGDQAIAVYGSWAATSKAALALKRRIDGDFIRNLRAAAAQSRRTDR